MENLGGGKLDEVRARRPVGVVATFEDVLVLDQHQPEVLPRGGKGALRGLREVGRERKGGGSGPVMLTAAQAPVIFWLPVVLLPLGVLGSGAVVSVRRKWQQ